MTSDSPVPNPELMTGEFMVESQPAAPSPELHPLSPAEQQLLEAISLPEELQEELHGQFQACIAKTVDSFVNPSDKETIASAASIIEWEWFAKRGDPLPDGIVIAKNLQLLPRAERLVAPVARARVFLDNVVLHDLERHRFSLLLQQGFDDEVRQSLVALAKESDIYKLLETIASDIPQPADTPLSPATRMIREAQIEQDVRMRHGLSIDEPLQPHPNAQRDLHRGTLQLDDETERRRVQRQQDGRSRLMAFLIDHFNAADTISYTARQPFPTLTSLYRDGEDIFGCDIDGNAVLISGDELFEFSIKVTQQYDPGHPLDYYSGRYSIIFNLVHELLKPESANLTIQEVLDASIHTCDLIDFYGARGGVSPEVLWHLRGTESEMVATPMRPGGNAMWHYPTQRSAISVVDRERAAFSEKNFVGMASGKLLNDAAYHLILDGNMAQTTYPSMVEDPDLVISTTKYIDGYPFVPGFELVAKHKQDHQIIYAYRQVEVDPYKGSAAVTIEPHNIEAVIEMCESIGFTDLATRLRSADAVSLADLATFTRQASDYTYDIKYDNPKTKNDTYTLDAWASLIDENGRLQVQCTGASAFLEMILGIALPGSNTSILAGKQIQPYGLINSAGHAQTVVTHMGEQYILDATPSLPGEVSRIGDSAEEIFNRQSTAERRHSADSCRADKLDETTDVELEIIDHTNTGRQAAAQQRMASAPDRIRRLAKAHFNLAVNSPDNQLYKALISLKPGADPLRRVMEVVIRNERGQDVATDITRVGQYLTSLATAEAGTARRMGIPQYSSAFLNNLQNALADI